MEIRSSHTPSLILNVPEWYDDKDFREWINDEENNLMTWHKTGSEPTELSDVILLVDPSLNGEGVDSDTMPDALWNEVIRICKERFRPGNAEHVIVRLTNLR